jgi:hypothetical protein
LSSSWKYERLLASGSSSSARLTNPNSQAYDLRLTIRLASVKFDGVPELDRQIVDDTAQFFRGQLKQKEVSCYWRRLMRRSWNKSVPTHLVNWNQFHSRFYVLHLNLICFYERPLRKQCEMSR